MRVCATVCDPYLIAYTQKFRCRNIVVSVYWVVMTPTMSWSHLSRSVVIHQGEFSFHAVMFIPYTHMSGCVRDTERDSVFVQCGNMNLEVGFLLIPHRQTVTAARLG